MNVSELIELLKIYPADMRVCVKGYEGGLCDVNGASVRDIQLNVNKEWYYGPHEEVSYEEKADEQALLIGDCSAR